MGSAGSHWEQGSDTPLSPRLSIILGHLPLIAEAPPPLWILPLSPPKPRPLCPGPALPSQKRSHHHQDTSLPPQAPSLPDRTHTLPPMLRPSIPKPLPRTHPSVPRPRPSISRSSPPSQHPEGILLVLRLLQDQPCNGLHGGGGGGGVRGRGGADVCMHAREGEGLA